jgi:hypothetical protein
LRPSIFISSFYSITTKLAKKPLLYKLLGRQSLIQTYGAVGRVLVKANWLGPAKSAGSTSVDHLLTNSSFPASVVRKPEVLTTTGLKPVGYIATENRELRLQAALSAPTAERLVLPLPIDKHRAAVRDLLRSTI